MIVGQFVEACRKKELKVNESMSKVMELNGEEGLECEVHIDGIHLKHVLDFKYLRCVLEESDKNGAEFSSKVAGAIRSLVNARDFELECASLACNIACTCSYVWQ